MRFIADCMLGRLAKELRMLGYDVLYYRGENKNSLFQLAREEGRVILTRSNKLIPKRPEDHIIRIMQDKPSLQVRELIQKRVISMNEKAFFSRCLLCNALLNKIPQREVEGKVPDFVFYQQKDFFQCPQCLRIYWQGSHLGNMQKKIEELF
jgi:uncharacterized protein with PIN domain